MGVELFGEGVELGLELGELGSEGELAHGGLLDAGAELAVLFEEGL